VGAAATVAAATWLKMARGGSPASLCVVGCFIGLARKQADREAHVLPEQIGEVARVLELVMHVI
jgi:hypothetical protein